MPPLIIAGLVMAAAQIGTGIAQKAKAAKIAAANKRPDYEIPNPVIENQRLLESLAQQGLTAGAKQAYTTANDRGLTSSIEAILKSGGSPNLVNEAYDTSQQGASRMALAEDEARIRNINMYIQGQNTLADEQSKKWGINKYAPYADKAQVAASLSNQGMDNIWKGINTGFSAAGAGINAKSTATAGLPTGATFNDGLQMNNNRNTPVELIPSNRTSTTMFTSNNLNNNFSTRSMNNMSNLGVMPMSSYNQVNMVPGSRQYRNYNNDDYLDYNNPSP